MGAPMLNAGSVAARGNKEGSESKATAAGSLKIGVLKIGVTSKHLTFKAVETLSC
jgi:hypothetical protein